MFPCKQAGEKLPRRDCATGNVMKSVWTRGETRYIDERYEPEINAFGCSFRELP
jgi:hypothetical protein